MSSIQLASDQEGDGEYENVINNFQCAFLAGSYIPKHKFRKFNKLLLFGDTDVFLDHYAGESKKMKACLINPANHSVSLLKSSYRHYGCFPCE